MNVSELEGVALDWAIAKCEGFDIVAVKGDCATFIDPADDGALNEMRINFSTDWAQGGPIIEREGINLDNYGKNPQWSAWTPAPDRESGESQAYGPTPLIAAMRCYVASKLGEEIDVPEALLNQKGEM